MSQIKLKDTTESAILFQPHVVVTVDSKGFSFRFLKLLQGTKELVNELVHMFPCPTWDIIILYHVG